MHKFLALIFLSLVVGCNNSQNLDNTNYDDPIPPESGGVLTNAMIGEPNNLIAMIAGDSASSAIAGQIFNALLKYDQNLGFEGDLADSWTISDDYKKITFNLKQDIKWADDKPFTCEDVLFTWKKVTDPDTRTPYGSDYQLVSSASCANNHIFIAEYDEPYAPALETWASLHILPEHLLKNENINDTYFSLNPTGTNFYALDEWTTGQQVKLKTNPNSVHGRPLLEKKITRIIPDLSSQFMELIAGNIDLMNINPIQYSRVFPSRSELNDKINLYKEMGNGYTYFGFNLKKKPFDDLNIRKAISYAINKEEIINGVLLGLGEEITSPYKPGTYWENKSINKISFDVSKSRELLEKSGYQLNANNIYEKDGKPLAFEILTNQNKQREMTAVLIQRRLQDIGIDVSIRVIEWASFVNRFIKTGEFEAVVLGWSLSLDPDQYSIWHSSQDGPGQFNFIGYNNPRVDTLLENGRKELKNEKRKQIYDEFSKIIYDEQPIIYLYAGYGLTAIHKKIKGVKKITPPAGVFHNDYEWYIPKKFRRNEMSL
ncbi:MAG: peptide-binding protein [Methylophilaceae bacterium]|jgi:peptide/nickel transport system substrate-binding protein|nr:peptide-binding protein [Methylophilaceae bacterium]NCV27791.1 peptide-binding protein [Nitrosomonadales bacterium]NCV37818.1 peptide-binding protein [Betaproteobacteria bacterium]MDA9914165.1 peptide-binding protein [Methylophilaceae bacterium]NCV53381.1 peptide-binding protein [Betaproteobacteria bacterium]